MLNLNQQKARHDLKADRERLAEELNFALEHKLPWGYSGWNSGNTEITSCEKHGDFERFTLVGKAFRGGENFKYSQCPACLRAQLSGLSAMATPAKTSCSARSTPRLGTQGQYAGTQKWYAKWYAKEQDAYQRKACQRWPYA